MAVMMMAMVVFMMAMVVTVVVAVMVVVHFVAAAESWTSLLLWLFANQIQKFCICCGGSWSWTILVEKVAAGPIPAHRCGTTPDSVIRSISWIVSNPHKAAKE